MIWPGIGIVCVALIVVIGVMQSARFRASRHVAGRPKLSEAEFASKFFPVEQRATAVKVRRLLASYVPVNVCLIHPHDRLVDDLGLAVRLSCGLDMVCFVQDMEEEFKIKFEEEDYLRMQTFLNAVEIVEEKRNIRQG